MQMVEGYAVWVWRSARLDDVSAISIHMRRTKCVFRSKIRAKNRLDPVSTESVSRYNPTLKVFMHVLFPRRAAAKEWTLWEMGTSKLLPDPAYIQKADNLDFAAAFARIECHYFVNAIFLEEAFILNNADKIKDIPVDIVQVSDHDSCLVYHDNLPC